MNALDNCHHIIKIGASNLLCPNRRLYDILLYQSCWEFFGTQGQVLVNEKGYKVGATKAVNSMQDIAKTHPLLVAIRRLEASIENYRQLNFDEHQYVDFLRK